jgi:16S rRNA (cytosine1402-N4)-methyltransferase
MSQNQHEEGREYHRPVLVDEVIGLMEPVVPGLVIDATFGGGGHSRRILEEFGDDVRVVGIDRDPEAVANGDALGIEVIEANFADLGAIARSLSDIPPVAIVFDFGVSSHQLDQPQRGFSYRREGPLDMRMGPDAVMTASKIVNEWTVDELAKAIRRFGEEPLAKRIAGAIAAARPIETTSQLATVIAEALPASRRRVGHPARRTFQAIRIAVNEELTAIREGIDAAIGAVGIGGRVIAISYHSLEDRIVKRRFAQGAMGCTCPPELPICGCGNVAELRILTRKPIRGTESEIETNNRSRSALLRAAEKVAA